MSTCYQVSSEITNPGMTRWQIITGGKHRVNSKAISQGNSCFCVDQVIPEWSCDFFNAVLQTCDIIVRQLLLLSRDQSPAKKEKGTRTSSRLGKDLAIRSVDNTGKMLDEIVSALMFLHSDGRQVPYIHARRVRF